MREYPPFFAPRTVRETPLPFRAKRKNKPVRGLRIEPAAYLQGKGGQLFQLVEDVYSCFLSDAYYLFHRFIVF